MIQIKHKCVVIPCEEGGYFAHFPSLPGCATVCDTFAELPVMVAEVYELWIEAATEHNTPIPPEEVE